MTGATAVVLEEPTAAAAAIEAAWSEGIQPEPVLTVAEWAAQYRVLSGKAASEPGPWRNERAPYLVKIMEALSATSTSERVVFQKGAQIGGPLALDTPVPTPDGWATMGELRAGDRVFDERGYPVTVLGVSRTFTDHECFAVTFSDGTGVVCDAQHLWSVDDAHPGHRGKRRGDNRPEGRRRTLRTAEMVGTVQRGKRFRYAIPCTQPLALEDEALPADPYALGVWLGDGHHRVNTFTIHEDDAEEVCAHIRDGGHATRITRASPNSGRAVLVTIDPRGTVKDRPSFLEAMSVLGVVGNKHIPPLYLRGSVSQRWRLLQGLMDTDGHVIPSGRTCQFYTVSSTLMRDVLELLRSLGLKPTLSAKAPSGRGRIQGTRPVQTATFTAYADQPLCALRRKQGCLNERAGRRATHTTRRRIVSIEPVETVPVRCIAVDSPSHLFLAGEGMIPTHNTELGLNWLGYLIHHVPGPIMAVSPTTDMARRTSKQRVDSLIEDTPELRSRVRDPRARDSGNTILAKEFPGGILVLTGANSAVGLRSMPARFLFLDEIDAYPPSADDEGDPVTLAERALRTFGRRRKVFMVSTPTVTGASRIEPELERCDTVFDYHVPCPSCGHLQPLVWERIRWPDGPDAPVYACAECEALIPEHAKTWMLAHGEWVARPGAKGDKAVGFFLSALYSPVGWFSWAEAVAMFQKGLTDEATMRIFRNTVLGLSFAEAHEAPKWRAIYDRRERYPMGVAPEGVLFIVAGVDVQKDRLELEVVGYGRGKTSWSLEYAVLDGDTARAEVWTALDAVLARDWPHADGGTPLPISVMCVDSGFETQHVYGYVRGKPQPFFGPAGAKVTQPRTVVAVKGQERGAAIVQGAIKAEQGTKKRGLRVYLVGTSLAKTELYGWLRLEPPTEEALKSGASYPPAYCHFPMYAEDYFKQLTAERLVRRMHKGFPRLSWEKDGGARNEALDARVYARTAAELFGLSRFTDRHWRELEELRANAPRAPEPAAVEGDGDQASDEPPAPVVAPRPNPITPRVSRRSSWMSR